MRHDSKRDAYHNIKRQICKQDCENCPASFGYRSECVFDYIALDDRVCI